MRKRKKKKTAILRSVRIIWSAEKWNAEQNTVNIRQSRPNMQAVPLASIIFEAY